MFRAPICTILGHVDAGKTLLLDRLRSTNVLASEVGGITQKIGVTFLSKETLDDIIHQTGNEANTTGLLLIDTPGHSCFTNQRVCGIDVSDIVVVVVDIFKGLEKQTIECINLLKEKKTPFVIAANKIDRIYDWSTNTNTTSIKKSLKKQKENTKRKFKDYMDELTVQCAENCINARVYYENKNPREFVSIVPLSAKTGEGVSDLLVILDKLTCKFLKKRITIRDDITQGWIVERIHHKSHGDVLTVILTDGQLSLGDPILFNSEYGEVVEATIKRLLVPSESKEIKDRFILTPVDRVEAATSVVIKIDYLGTVQLGSRFFSYSDDILKSKYTQELEKSMREVNFKKDNPGIFINASSIGMCIALTNLCRSENIPVNDIIVGPTKKSDLIKVAAILDLSGDEDDKLYNRRYSVILAYGIGVPKELHELLKQMKIKVVSSEVVYRLIEGYQTYCTKLDDRIRKKYAHLRPICKMHIFEQFIFLKKNPILMGVKVLENTLVKGMTIVAKKDGEKDLVLGEVTSIEQDRQPKEEMGRNEDVCIKIEPTGEKYEYGKDFDASYHLETQCSAKDLWIMQKFKDILL